MLEKYNCYWMVLRIWVRLNRPIIWGETLTVQVTVRKPVGTRVYRDCDLYVGKEYVGEATSMWVLANRKTKRLISLENLPELPSENIDTAKSITYPESDFRKRWSSMTAESSITATPTSTGTSTTRAMWTWPVTRRNWTKRPHGVFMQEILISYVNECFAGESLDIFRGKDSGQLYIHGSCGQEDRFDCTIRMSSPEGL